LYKYIDANFTLRTAGVAQELLLYKCEALEFKQQSCLKYKNSQTQKIFSLKKKMELGVV
jgi:hypothetical protein